jgi:hypothetical protein
MFPLALVGLYLIKKPRKDAWKGSFLHAILLIPLSYLFAYGTNLNCMHESCVSFIPTTSLYPIYWLPLFLIVVVLPVNFLLYWILQYKFKKDF